MRGASILSPIVTLAAIVSGARASVTLYQGPQDFTVWSAAAGAFTTIDFTGYPQNTFITDQYVDEGVLFTSSDPDVIVFEPAGFPLDGVGLNGVHVVEMQFLQPTFSFAYFHPGKHGAFLYLGETLIYSSPALGGGGIGFFSGMVSTLPFDRIVLLPWDNPNNFVGIDNLYFSSVPAPAGALVLGFLAFSRAGARRARQ